MRYTNLTPDERDQLSNRAVEVCIAILGPPNQNYSGNPRWGSKGSKVLLPQGVLHDHSEGETFNMVDLVVRHVGGSFTDAKDWIRRFIGSEPFASDPAPVLPFTPKAKVWPEVARVTWENATGGERVRGELKGRGIHWDFDTPNLRYNRRTGTQVALYELPDGSPSTVQLTYRNGRRHWIKGALKQGTACLVGRRIKAEGQRVRIVGEGIENALSFAQLACVRGSIPFDRDVRVWATGDAGNMPNWNHDQTEGMNLLIAADHDDAGIKAAEKLEAKFPGSKIVKPKQYGYDWNDVLIEMRK